ncbi:hypothetical protein TorRG33x02_133750 [Trema orientale]|uniref:Uncharacterized protein n=1 Tax=Trema orientale TaxID=63057 RepID=A0A2P5EYX4_TREOI|nr:hypothetical protein TorRG33x02_133750 [Trema orientale]
MDEKKVDDNPIFPTQFRERMVSEYKKDIIEKGIETAISLEIDKEGGEEKDANDDDFVTQVDAGKKADREKTATIE